MTGTLQMVVHVIAALVLAVGILFAGGTWWQLRKRASYLKECVTNQPYLEGFFGGLMWNQICTNPPSGISEYVHKRPHGYIINIEIVLKADQTSQRIPKVVSTICLILILGVSFYLGYLYFAINLGLFLLLGFSPLTESARRNAVDQLVTLAVILHKWYQENPKECDETIGQLHGLQKLHAAVKRAATESTADLASN